MKKVLAITAIALLSLTVISCASTSATSSGHGLCGAYGNP